MLDRSAIVLKHFGTEDPNEIKALEKEADYLDLGPPEKWTKLSLPYYAPDPSLPPIPTPEDIENARSREEIRRVLYDKVGVFRVNEVYAVKVSHLKSVLQEAENLLFLHAQDQKPRLPKVYAVFAHQGADPVGRSWAWKDKLKRSELPIYYYLVMDFIDGITIHEDLWNGLEESAQVKILGKLAEQLRLLRSIPPPNPSYYGSVNYQGYRPLLGFIMDRRRNFPGPFDTYEAFLDQMYKAFEIKAMRKLEWKGDIPAAMQLILTTSFVMARRRVRYLNSRTWI